MGLGFYVRAPIAKRGWFGRQPSREHVLRSIAHCIDTQTTDPLERRMLSFGRRDHTLAVSLNPGAEALEFTWQPDQHITASSKTSTIGPGYHAHLISLLDRVAAACGLEWSWQGDEDSLDETQYAVDRDFARLQRDFAIFFGGLAGLMLRPEYADSTHSLCLNWGIHQPGILDPVFSATPLGPRSREWWVAATGDNLTAAARELMPWWNLERDAAYWYRTGLMLLWSEVRWHPPATPEEKELYRLALDCLGRSRQLDAKLALPEAEMDELGKLLDQDATAWDEPPAANGIGFLRRPMRFHVGRGWTVVLPGYYHDLREENTFGLYWGERTVRISTNLVESTDGQPKPVEDLLIARQAGPEDEVVQFNHGCLHGRALVGPYEERGWKGWWLHGMVVACTPGPTLISAELALVTIISPNEADRTWAVETFSSVQHPDPQPDSPAQRGSQAE